MVRVFAAGAIGDQRFAIGIEDVQKRFERCRHRSGVDLS